MDASVLVGEEKLPMSEDRGVTKFSELANGDEAEISLRSMQDALQPKLLEERVRRCRSPRQTPRSLPPRYSTRLDRPKRGEVRSYAADVCRSA